ncbi:MAG: LptF/LptG family permease [Armatimonadota bacterium]|nr:LptF/LptG family permease [bacterium]
MKTLDKYVAREMLVPFFAGFSVVLVLLIGNIIYNNIAIIVSRIQQWPSLLYYILLQTPYFVLLALPSGALFGCSLAISRLTRDSETTMMRMAGISVMRIFLPIFVFGFLISMVAYVFQEKVTSWAESESTRVLRKLWLAPGPPPVEANVFFKAENCYFYVNTVEHHGNKLQLGDVMVYEPPVGKGFPTLTTAKSASEDNHVWMLYDGVTYRVNRDGDPELIGHFKKMKLDLRQAISDYIKQQQKTPKGMTIAELRGEMGRLAKSGLKTDTYQLEYGYKLAIPLSSLVLLFCVAPLSLRFGRGGGFMGVLIGIGVLFFYWNVILFSRVLGETGGLPPVIAGWSEVIIFTVLGAVLMWKVE